MGIVIVIIVGVAVITLIAGGFDYLGKRSLGVSGDVVKKIENLENRVQSLEKSIIEKDEEIKQLDTKVQFMDRLLEDTSRKHG